MSKSENSFEEWYRAAYEDLRVSVTATIGDRDVALEAVDEACVRAYARWARVARMDSPTGWAYRVATNVARRQFSQVKKRRQREIQVTRDAWVGRAVLPQDIGHLALEELLHELPRRQQEAVSLCFILDLTENDAATALGISRTAIATHLCRARTRLRTLYAENMGAPEEREVPRQ